MKFHHISIKIGQKLKMMKTLTWRNKSVKALHSDSPQRLARSRAPSCHGKAIKEVRAGLEDNENHFGELKDEELGQGGNPSQ